MKLYYSPGACSLSPHIALCEAGLEFQLEKVDLGTKKTETGADFLKVNPKGYVPALQLDDGQLLTESSVVAQYVADKKPGAKLVPPAGTMERYRLMEWMNFISTEIHKQFSPLFNPTTPAAQRQTQIESLGKRFDYVAKALDGKQYLLGDQFTVADAYLFTVANWGNYVKLDLGKWPVLQKYLARVAARPAVKKALEAEGLLKK